MMDYINVTKPRPQLMCTEHFVKLGGVVSEICERTDRQTRSLQYLAPLVGMK